MKVNLKEYTTLQLAEIANYLNRWEWHILLGDEPDGWNQMLDFHPSKDYKLPTKYKLIKPIVNEIESMIGEKEILRWNFLDNLDRTDKEFNQFWLKRKLQKFFRIGFYSRKTQRVIVQALTEIRDKNHEDNVNNRFK